MSDLSNIGTITATLSAVESIVGTLSIPSGQSYDEYDGDYTVTPSESEQTLATNGLLMTDDVTVSAVSDTYIGSGITQMAGQTVTPTESSQTVETSGKYLTGDITVNAIPSQYKDMSGQYAWMGADAEYVGQIYTETVALEDTTFASWTPSTTASAIQATASVATFSADMATYDYYIRWTMVADIAQASGATLKATIVKQVSQVYQQVIRRPSNRANLIADTFNYNACMTLGSAYYADYYNTSGTEVMAYTASYGFYQTVQAATLSSTTSDSPTVTVKRPILYARCSSTYFATARASEVDQSESTITLTADLFRVPISNGILKRMYETLADVYNE